MRVHQRFSTFRAVACRQPSQLHVGPQLQTSPHWQEVLGAGAEFWQPHVHWVPPQVSHPQTFD
jgi:hypothetical protein